MWYVGRAGYTVSSLRGVEVESRLPLEGLEMKKINHFWCVFFFVLFLIFLLVDSLFVDAIVFFLFDCKVYYFFYSSLFCCILHTIPGPNRFPILLSTQSILRASRPPLHFEIIRFITRFSLVFILWSLSLSLVLHSLTCICFQTALFTFFIYIYFTPYVFGTCKLLMDHLYRN
jgi:hypothetical protein